MKVEKTDNLISDLHFGHENIIGFCRPQFDTLDEMHEYMIESWNAKVKPGDRVIVAGDFAMNPKYYYLLNALNGEKAAVLGNHDLGHEAELIQYCSLGLHPMLQVWLEKPEKYEVGKYNGKRGLITHMPVHVQALDRYEYNFHGHLHDKYVRNQNDWENVFEASRDMRYINVSCEVLNFVPRTIEELISAVS